MAEHVYKNGKPKSLNDPSLIAAWMENEDIAWLKAKGPNLS